MALPGDGDYVARDAGAAGATGGIGSAASWNDGGLTVQARSDRERRAAVARRA